MHRHTAILLGSFLLTHTQCLRAEPVRPTNHRTTPDAIVAPTATAPAPRAPVRHQVDVNADGYADVVVTEERRTNTTDFTEADILVYLGSPSGVHTTPDARLTAPGGSAFQGQLLLTSLGDINGDGATDILASNDDEPSNSLVGYLYLGSPRGLAATPALTLRTPHRDRDHAFFAPLGDVNHDGYADFAASVSCPPADWPVLIPDRRICTPNLSALYVYYGARAGLSATPALRIEEPWALFSWTALGVGDMNGDGFDDVLWDHAGHPQIHLGSGAGLNRTAAVRLTAPGGARPVLHSATAAGDLNHDGFADLLFVAGPEPLQRASSAWSGGTLVFLGASHLISLPSTAHRALQYSTVRLGDLDRDGFDDLLEQASCRVYAGSSTGLSATPSPAMNPPRITAPGTDGFTSGYSPGDLNGDGWRDLVLLTTYNDQVVNLTVFNGGPHGVSATPSAVLTGSHRIPDSYLRSVALPVTP